MKPHVITHEVAATPDSDTALDSITVVQDRNYAVYTFVDFMDPGLGYFIDPDGHRYPSYTHDATPPLGSPEEVYYAYMKFLEDTYA